MTNVQSDEMGEFTVDDAVIVFPKFISAQIYEKLKDIVGDGKVTRGNIVTLLLSIMQFVDSYTHVSGLQKKAIVLDCLYRIIDDQIDDDTEKTDLKLLVSLTLPNVIDSFVRLDRRQLRVNIQRCCGFRTSLKR